MTKNAIAGNYGFSGDARSDYDSRDLEGDGLPDGVVGALVKGDTIIITKAAGGFGTGPNLVMYDGADGVIGNELKMNDPMIGSYEADSGQDYQAGGRDGGACLRWIRGTDSRSSSTILLGGEYTEVFFSYGYKHFSGFYAPYATAPDAFGTSSNSKPAWMFWGDDGNDGKNDLVMISHLGNGRFLLGGNDRNLMENVGGSSNAEWWEFGEWMRQSYWLKADETNPTTANGTSWIQMINSTNQYQYIRTDQPIFDTDKSTDGDEPFAWDRIRMGAWIRTPASGEMNHAFDDIYVAAGPNAAKRVELGNNAVYANCSELVICPHSTWADTQIKATVELGELNLGTDVWAFVIGADNTVIEQVKVI